MTGCTHILHTSIPFFNNMSYFSNCTACKK